MNANKYRAIGQLVPLWIASLLLAVPLAAHDPGLSAAEVRVLPQAVEAAVTFHSADLGIEEQDFETARPRLRELASEALVVMLDGLPVETLAADATWKEIDDASAVELRMVFERPPESERLELISALLGELPRGHRQYMRVRTESGDPLGEVILDAENHSFTIAIEPSEPAAALGSFFKLGVEHILTGYDHLLFLAALLIAAPGFGSAAKIVTSFTAAHSLTLALAAFDLVHVPAAIVEPLIAASVLWVGVENLLRKNPPGRWKLTFGLGLIHGLGFAGVLRGLDIGDANGALRALLGFNLGVEAGQLALVAAALPLLAAWRHSPRFSMVYAPAASLLIALVGAGMFFLRAPWA